MVSQLARAIAAFFLSTSPQKGNALPYSPSAPEESVKTYGRIHMTVFDISVTLHVLASIHEIHLGSLKKDLNKRIRTL